MNEATHAVTDPLTRLREAMKPEPMSEEQAFRYAEKSLAWYGWGSPVGLSILLVSIGILCVCLRQAQLLP